MSPQEVKQKYWSFAELQRATETSDYRQARRGVRAKVRDREAFEEQKRYLLSLQEGVEVQHSFVDVSGQVFDCVPIEQQSALRRSGEPLATVPRPPHLHSPEPRAKLIAPFGSGRTDRFGDAMGCPRGTVPLRRLTLEELNRFETLDAYLHKPRHPRRAGAPPLADVAGASSNPHSYAYQDVPNIGGHSIMSVWQPSVSGNQIFSLSQIWCVGQNAGVAQTVEAGWQVYPTMYGHNFPTLFAYWSRLNYQQGGYDYNAFVQVGTTHALGMAYQAVSLPGGQQVDLELCFLLQQGRWWLFLNGIDQPHAIGYFPASLFAGGPLSVGATRVEYGGETAGAGSYPPMGSGAYAAAGPGHAASHRSLHYFTADGTLQPMVPTPVEEWPPVYTILMDGQPGADPFFFFGGPGSGGGQAG